MDGVSDAYKVFENEELQMLHKCDEISSDEDSDEKNCQTRMKQAFVSYKVIIIIVY